jgi:hypothetical protein
MGDCLLIMTWLPCMQVEQATTAEEGAAAGGVDSAQEAPVDWQSEAAVLEQAVSARAQEATPPLLPFVETACFRLHC